MKTIKSLAILAVLIIPSALALAAGIQVSPSELSATVAGGKTTSLNITVVNPTADVQVYEVYADDFSSAITAIPESFTLQSGEKKVVDITIDAAMLKNQAGEKLATSLSVVGKPLADNKFSIGTGVKIPITIILGNDPPKTDKKQ